MLEKYQSLKKKRAKRTINRDSAVCAVDSEVANIFHGPPYPFIFVNLGVSVGFKCWRGESKYKYVEENDEHS